ncbi:phosphopantetheine-binding protein [Hydrogenimonas thermophila]|uniref:phosphopantetheine-binding protein n=1 Tax=Hydrogenimonas thermophila TaxID=223786 RepID=UPI0029372905|nr:phosphopantetheine-binding protein [Hydrogenimonas thermophila]WOE69625.1 phosphopantetheine-binding protein [Hydrogenimonas thermophila]WOE72139.1 phosphopantetheine-binding protein [Hydrogenimonas thermophila]
MVSIEEIKIKVIESLQLEDLEVDELEDDMPLFGDEGLGLDSVDAIELTLMLEREFGVKITDMSKVQTIFTSCATLAEYINKCKNGK